MQEIVIVNFRSKSLICIFHCLPDIYIAVIYATVCIKKIPHRNKSQVQVSLKVTAQIHHLNITVMLDFFFFNV